jgi:hypothetical protein
MLALNVIVMACIAPICYATWYVFRFKNLESEHTPRVKSMSIYEKGLLSMLMHCTEPDGDKGEIRLHLNIPFHHMHFEIKVEGVTKKLIAEVPRLSKSELKREEIRVTLGLRIPHEPENMQARL